MNHNPTSANPPLGSTPARLQRRSIGPVSLAFRYEGGSGTPVVFVHGSLDDHNGWTAVLNAIREHEAAGPRPPMLAYDRRGHGASTDEAGQGTLSADVDDLAALVASQCGGQAHLVGHSYGATIALECARSTPEAVRSVFLLEPPLFGLLRDDPAFAPRLADAKTAIEEALGLLEAGELEDGVELFVDRVAFGEGAWRGRLDAAARSRMLAHADTWIDQAKDPQRLSASPQALEQLGPRATLCTGTQSLPTFAGVAAALTAGFPQLVRVSLEGAAHDAPATHAVALARAVRAHLVRVGYVSVATPA